MTRISNSSTTWIMIPTDLYLTCSTEILKKRITFSKQYLPGINNITKPLCYNQYITDKEWYENITIINQIILKWWLPGSYISCISYYLGFILIFPLFIYYALDEEGLYCFRNRKRKQLYNILKPVCEELSITSPLIWSVSLSGDPKDYDDDTKVKELILTTKLKTPISQDELQLIDKKEPNGRSRIVSFIYPNQEVRDAKLVISNLENVTEE